MVSKYNCIEDILMIICHTTACYVLTYPKVSFNGLDNHFFEILVIWSRPINNLEEFSKLNMLQDHIWKSTLLQENITNMFLEWLCISNMVLEHIWLSKFFHIINDMVQDLKLRQKSLKSWTVTYFECWIGVLRPDYISTVFNLINAPFLINSPLHSFELPKNNSSFFKSLNMLKWLQISPHSLVLGCNPLKIWNILSNVLHYFAFYIRRVDSIFSTLEKERKTNLR